MKSRSTLHLFQISLVVVLTCNLLNIVEGFVAPRRPFHCRTTISQPKSGLRPNDAIQVLRRPRAFEPLYEAKTSLYRPSESNKYRLLGALAFMTGVADVLLIRKYRTFATMMTGNSMWLMMALSEGELGTMVYYASIIVSYVLGLAIFRKAEMTWKESSLSRFIAPVVGAIFIGSDLWSLYYPNIRWPASNALSLAYGMVNSVGTEMAGTLAFVVTGHLTRFTQTITDRVSRQAGRKELDRKIIKQFVLVFGGFCFGSLTAFQTFARFPQLLYRFGGLSMMGVSYTLLLLWQDRSTLEAWWYRKNEKYCTLDKYDSNCE